MSFYGIYTHAYRNLLHVILTTQCTSGFSLQQMILKTKVGFALSTRCVPKSQVHIFANNLEMYHLLTTLHFAETKSFRAQH